MAAPRQLPDTEALLRLRRQGWTYQDIASEYGVTEGAVYLQLQKVNATTRRPDNKDLIPWVVKVEHTHARPVTMLRLLGRRRRGDKTIPPVKERMLDKWLRELQEADAVVCYHPDMPPNAASPSSGGWYYSRRRPEDGEALVRADSGDGPPVIKNPKAKV